MAVNLNGNVVLSSGLTYNSVWTKRITRDGLVLCLDAGDVNSYPGTGTTWYDLSGKGHNYTVPGGWTWNSAGYFQTDGTNAATGPASNATTWGFNTFVEHYIEVWIAITTVQNNTFMYWEASPNTGSDLRAISLHLPYGTNIVYYDVAGCCATTQRVSYTDYTLSGGSITHMAFRSRQNGFYQREVFKNLVSQVNSGTYLTSTVTWDKTTSTTLGSSWAGKIYVARAYNRPLHPYEMAENFQADRQRFGV